MLGLIDQLAFTMDTEPKVAYGRRWKKQFLQFLKNTYLVS